MEKQEENKKLKTELDALMAEVTKLKKAMEVKSISQSVDNAASLSDHNKRFPIQNQRLRDDLSQVLRETTITQKEKKKTPPARQVAFYVDNKAAVALKAGDRERKELLNEIATLNQQVQERDAHIRILTTNEETKEKLTLAIEKNKRLTEENNRLRLAVEQAQQHDIGSRFKNQNVMGRMIEGYKGAQQNTDKQKSKPSSGKNETDDMKLQKVKNSK